MPVPRKKTTPPAGDRAAIARMLRQVLIEARGSYVVWGMMLRGPTPVEGLTETDLAGLIRVVERCREEGSL